MKVLIADDSRTMRRILAHHLELTGVRSEDMVEVDAGNEVMPTLEKDPDIGLVLLDWNMPFMNGLDCLKAIRAHPALGKLAVVMVTSEAAESNIAEAYDCGVSGYLVKSFDENSFGEVIGPFVS